MTLRQKQSIFAERIATLILLAKSKGYEVTFGDAYRDPRVHGEFGEKKGYSHSRSTHKVRLAVDLNLFKDGQLYPEGHQELHDIWDMLSPGLASARILNDMNHYSFENEGVR